MNYTFAALSWFGPCVHHFSYQHSTFYTYFKSPRIIREPSMSKFYALFLDLSARCSCYENYGLKGWIVKSKRASKREKTSETKILFQNFSHFLSSATLLHITAAASSKARVKVKGRKNNTIELRMWSISAFFFSLCSALFSTLACIRRLFRLGLSHRRRVRASI